MRETSVRPGSRLEHAHTWSDHDVGRHEWSCLNDDAQWMSSLAQLVESHNQQGTGQNADWGNLTQMVGHFNAAQSSGGGLQDFQNKCACFIRLCFSITCTGTGFLYRCLTCSQYMLFTAGYSAALQVLQSSKWCGLRHHDNAQQHPLTESVMLQRPERQQHGPRRH